MADFKQQAIIWVRFPFSHMYETKFRPAVIVSNNSYNSKQEDIVVCAITSKLDEREYSILVDEKNIAEGRLPLRSRIRADKIMQIEKSLVAKAFARLNDKTFDLLVQQISKLVKRSIPEK